DIQSKLLDDIINEIEKIQIAQ
ncbi:MarR family transcriptional regulator, partial [Staphylococcus saprophyticus]